MSESHYIKFSCAVLSVEFLVSSVAVVIDFGLFLEPGGLPLLFLAGGSINASSIFLRLNEKLRDV